MSAAVPPPEPRPAVARGPAVFSTPFFRIATRTVAGQPEPYYALETLDYVSVLAITPAGGVLLVRQHRPVLDAVTLELPAGHVDPGETPEASARRELLEETGHRAARCELLGELDPDTGRLANRNWCFRASELTRVGPPEPGIELIERTPAELVADVAAGRLRHAIHVAHVLLHLVERGAVRAP